MRLKYVVLDDCGNGQHDDGEEGIDCGDRCPNVCNRKKLHMSQIFKKIEKHIVQIENI